MRSQSSRYPDPVWPTEKFADSVFSQSDAIERSISLVSQELAWFENASGVGFSDIQERVLEQYKRTEYQQWLVAIRQGRETLNPVVWERLGLPAITTVIFDAGSVLLDVNDDTLFLRMTERLGVTTEAVKQAVYGAGLDESMRGAIAEKEYLRRFYTHLGRPMPESLEEARGCFVYPDIYPPMEGMKSIVETLVQNGIRVVVLSDCIDPLADIVRQKVEEFFPEIGSEHIFVSAQIGTSKRNNGEAFDDVIRRLGLDPQTAVFVDDVGRYTDYARQRGIAGITFEGNPFTSISASERVTRELEAAGLL